MDVQLPGMDGLAATAILKQEPLTASIPVIALTALAMKSDQEKSRIAGCDDYIAKPLRYKELYAAIDLQLSKRNRPVTSPTGGATRMTEDIRTILIVDNDSRNRKLLDTMLMPEGYQTRSAATGEEVLASVLHSAPDLILLDVMIPGMDGYEVASSLKSSPLTSNIPIIIVSAQIDRGARLAGLDAGAEDFLTKPVERAELSLRVRNLLRLKAYGDLQKNHRNVLEQEAGARNVDLQRFRTAMDATADGIMLISCCTMRFIEVNATACDMFGYSRAELLQIRPAELGAGSLDELQFAYDELIAGRSGTALVASELTRRDGSTFHAEVHRQAQHSGTEWVIVAVVRDITERQLAENRLHHLAHFDVLTGLPNRALFYDTLKSTLQLSQQNRWSVAVLLIDLDHFKNVNDTRGQACGDELLLQFGERLAHCVRLRETVGRLGGAMNLR